MAAKWGARARKTGPSPRVPLGRENTRSGIQDILTLAMDTLCWGLFSFKTKVHPLAAAVGIVDKAIASHSVGLGSNPDEAGG